MSTSRYSPDSKCGVPSVVQFDKNLGQHSLAIVFTRISVFNYKRIIFLSWKQVIQSDFFSRNCKKYIKGICNSSGCLGLNKKQINFNKLLDNEPGG